MKRTKQSTFYRREVATAAKDRINSAECTPGPWTLDEVWMLVKGPNGEEICAVHSGQGDNERVDRSIACMNATLISLAPELLATLKRALPFLACGTPRCDAMQLEVIELINKTR